jgi:predicted cupin superfamily sugar epimerase
MSQQALDWIQRLGLIRHPEGGYYREVYRAKDLVSVTTETFDRSSDSKPRAALTSIYFLLEAPDFSHLHRIDADEIWYWHAGDVLRIEVITKQGAHESLLLGPSESLQVTVLRGSWFGATLANSSGWALVSCAVAPGFEFSLFELAHRSRLIAEYPEHRELIARLTKG